MCTTNDAESLTSADSLYQLTFVQKADEFVDSHLFWLGNELLCSGSRWWHTQALRAQQCTLSLKSSTWRCGITYLPQSSLHWVHCCLAGAPTLLLEFPQFWLLWQQQCAPNELRLMYPSYLLPLYHPYADRPEKWTYIQPQTRSVVAHYSALPWHTFSLSQLFSLLECDIVYSGRQVLIFQEKPAASIFRAKR